MTFTASSRKSALKAFHHLTSTNLAPRELGAEQTRQFCAASRAFHTYVLKDGQILEPIFKLVLIKTLHVTILNGKCFLQLVVKDVEAKGRIIYEIFASTEYKALCYFPQRFWWAKTLAARNRKAPEMSKLARLQTWRPRLCKNLGMRSRSLRSTDHCELSENPTRGSAQQ